MSQSRGLSVDQRLERMLERRYPGAQMDALGGGFFSKIGKALKKVVPVALGAAAIYFTAGAAGGLLAKGGGAVLKKTALKKVGGSVLKKTVLKKAGGAVLKKAVKGVGKVAVAVASGAASAAISAGAIPIQPGALRSNEELLSTAVQIARSQLMNEGIAMNSPEAQDIVRQAVEESGQVPSETGFDFKKYLPWIAGGGALLAVVAFASPRRAR